MNIRVRSRFITALLATGMALPLWLPAATDSLHKAIHLGSNATVAGETAPGGRLRPGGQRKPGKVREQGQSCCRGSLHVENVTGQGGS